MLAERGTPTVLVDRMTGDPRFDYVAIDDRGAMHDATRISSGSAIGAFFTSFGTRDLRPPSGGSTVIATPRPAARPAVAAALCQRDDDEAAFARQIADALADTRPPSAIIASNSAIALSLLRILHDLDVRWPDDVSILAFDEPVWAPIVTPPLAVVRHPTQQIALETWQRLLLRFQKPDVRPKRITLEAKLIVDASLGPPPRARRTRTSGPAR